MLKLRNKWITRSFKTAQDDCFKKSLQNSGGNTDKSSSSSSDEESKLERELVDLSKKLEYYKVRKKDRPPKHTLMYRNLEDFASTTLEYISGGVALPIIDTQTHRNNQRTQSS